MSKRKGISFEEKRTRLADFFYETKDFWLLKDIEKIASKQKGIVVQSIKEVLDSLVSDNIVTVEKIGTSNYYWSFPSTAVQNRKRRIAELGEELANVEAKRQELDSALAQRKNGREETEERIALMERLKEAEAINRNLLAELEMFKDSDPVLVAAKENAIVLAKNAVNRWTENIFALQSYCSQTFGIPPQQFAEQFNIPDDFDSV
ncbi:meiotic nuclear division protein 1 [Powellomyces hirtus]|nr:meiotic nuclear division protein 1 [Powellomyces hirtus]